jgi:signal transduction histidine kinase
MDPVLYSLPPLLTATCFAALSGMAFIRGSGRTTEILFGCLCAIGALLYINFLFLFNMSSPRQSLLLERTTHAVMVWLPPLFTHFFHRYLGVSNRRWLLTALYTHSCCLFFTLPTPLYFTGIQKFPFGYMGRGGILYPYAVHAGVTLYCAGLLIGYIRRARQRFRRIQYQYVLAGFGTVGLLNGANMIATMGYPLYPPGCWSFVPLIVFTAGILRHDLLDMGILLKNSLLYSLVTLCLTLLYALVIVGIETLFPDDILRESYLLQAGFFLMVAFIVGPLRSYIQNLLERLFFRSRHAYRATLADVSRWIVTIRDREAILARLCDTILSTTAVTRCRIHLTDAVGGGRDDAPLPKDTVDPLPQELTAALQHRQAPLDRRALIRPPVQPGEQKLLEILETLGCETAVPMPFDGQLVGVLLLGETRSGSPLSTDDLDLLGTISRQAALALTNAKAYHLLENLNRQLEKRVAQRTAALEGALKEKEMTRDLLVRKESLAALGQLVAGVAHEMNNPLASVTSLIQSAVEELHLLQRKCPIDELLIEDLDFADRELTRARSIVASLLDLSRQTQTYEETIHLNTVVENALRVLNNRIKYTRIKVTTDLQPGLPPLTGNFANVGQVVLNIVKNALQAIGEVPGSIRIRTFLAPGEKGVVFSCADTGPGIAPERMQDICKPFFTTKPVGQGTGLGLYLSHEIITRHGGVLDFANRSRGGARFTVQLPFSLHRLRLPACNAPGTVRPFPPCFTSPPPEKYCRHCLSVFSIYWACYSPNHP